MKLFIIAVKTKPFTGSSGTEIPYHWYTARKPDGTRIQFGSKVGTHPIGQEVELIVEKYEKSNGEAGYKEITIT